MNDNSVDIKAGGDVIGVNVSGSGNIIAKNISIVINAAKSLGLNLLPPNYFDEYKSTEVDFENWRKGFSFNKLAPIKGNMEFKRTKLLDDIKNRLDQHHLLLVGESGMSKSTILMEIICDYFDLGYKILYNFEDTKITQGTELIQFIQGLLTEGNKVLVAIDNAHDERAAVIFYVMDQLSNYILSNNVRFLITARLPEYDWFINRLGKVQEDKYVESIKKFKSPKFRYELPAFTKEEIKAFIIKYKEISTVKEEDYESVYNYTKGHPIMVKFSVLGEGLRNDVESRYEHYLYDRRNDQAYPFRIETTLVCSLLDIANLQITDDLLENMKLLEFAFQLERAILHYQNSDKLWKTIHPRWDTELISYLYSENERGVILQRKEYLKKSIYSIFNIKDKNLEEREQRTASVVSTLYGIMADGKIPVDIVEETIEVPHYLSEDTKCDLYVWTMASTYLDLERYEDAIAKCNLALEVNNNFSDAWHIKGIALYHLNKYAEAVKCYENATYLDPYNIEIWRNKAESLQKLGRYHEAIKCHKKVKEIETRIGVSWFENALGLSRSGKYHEAIQLYDAALEIDPKNVDAWNNKGWALMELGKYEQAIECYEQALETDSENFNIWFNKGYALNELGKCEQAIECYEQAIDIDPRIAVAWNNKGWALNELGKYEQAIECYEQATDIDPKFAEAWNNKGKSLTELSKIEEAEKCFAKAKKLGLKT